MNILFDNKVLNSTVSAGLASANYPVDNLKSINLHQKYQSIDTSDTITVVFDDNINIDCFFFGYTNMSSMVVSFFNELDELLEKIVFFADGSVGHYYGYPIEEYYGYTDQFYGYLDRQGNEVYDPVAWYLTKELSVKKITIELQNDLGYPVYLGGIATGLCENVGIPLAKWEDDFDDKSIVSESEAGQILQQYIRPFRKYNFKFPVNTRKRVVDIMKQYQQYAIGAHLWVDPFERNHDFMEPLYCTLVSPLSATKDGYNWEFNFNIREAR